MKKRTMLQISLWLTAIIVTVLFCNTSFGLVKPLGLLSFILFVLLPQVIAIILQLFEVHERFVGMLIDIVRKHFGHKHNRPLCTEYISVYTNAYAVLKRQGINPNRAGPLLFV